MNKKILFAAIGSALAATNTAAVAPVSGIPFRLRALLRTINGGLATSSEAFKLQYATSTPGGCDAGYAGETYDDIGASTGTLHFYDNASTSDGTALTSSSSDPTDGGRTVRNQTYEEANNFTNSISGIAANEDGL